MDIIGTGSLNLYTYVHNNPLIYVDPSGHKVWLIHGAEVSGKGAGPDTWTPEFREYVEDMYNESSDALEWTGKNRKDERYLEAERLTNKIYNWHMNNQIHGKLEPIRLVGHSHGGNVAILIANLLAEKGLKVDTLITIATPVRGYQLKQEVGQHLHVYNERDGVQVNGGSIWLLGKARRTFDAAANVKVEVDKKYDGIESHSVMHSNIDIWKQYIQGLLADFYVKP